MPSVNFLLAIAIVLTLVESINYSCGWLRLRWNVYVVIESLLDFASIPFLVFFLRIPKSHGSSAI